MKKLVTLDIESYPNYFLVVFKGNESGKVVSVQVSGERNKLDNDQKRMIRRIMGENTTIGYNSINYDLVVLTYALTSEATCKKLYEATKMIIERGLQHWQSYDKLGIKPRDWDHIDIKEPAPAVMISLKNYGTRIHSRKLQDLPYPPDTHLDSTQRYEVAKYCENDVDVTIDLYNAIEKWIKLRERMSDEYGIDLRSKSDAQIAEHVIASQLWDKYEIEAKRPKLRKDYVATYSAPSYIGFKTPELQELLYELEHTEFEVADNGQVKLPRGLSNRKYVIGDTTYKLGIGGLHSQEKSLVRVSNEENVMRNMDFASYYPFIIIMNRLYPKHLGVHFLNLYKDIVDTRLKAKADGNKDVASSLKITINGAFGKLGSKWSKLYSPDLMLAVTLTGQLTLLMLIEQLEAKGIPVVSANTDGLEYYCPRDKVDMGEAIAFDLELSTGYVLEHGEYRALYARDVNNYVAVYPDKAKAKGVYREGFDPDDPDYEALKKGLSTPIVFTAIREYLLNGTSIVETIHKCTDMRQFLAARTVKGGAVWREEYLGKMVRWYYAKDGSPIHYKSNGNLVPKTAEGDGAKPMMELSESLPEDLEYRWYIGEALDKLKDLGVSYE